MYIKIFLTETQYRKAKAIADMAAIKVNQPVTIEHVVQAIVNITLRNLKKEEKNGPHPNL